jgi:ferric-dicitrate binding protein FerR (iron transport regulator)
MLYPSQQAVFRKQQHTMEAVTHADMHELHIWKKLNLTFDNTSLKDVVAILNKQFDVEIVPADDALNSYSLNADLSGLNLPEIMEILKKTLNINYQITGNRITISRNQ